MLDAKEKPKAVLAIVGKLKRKGEGSDKEPDGDESYGADDEDKKAAGEELASAIKSGDGGEIYRAFEALKELCESGE